MMKRYFPILLLTAAALLTAACQRDNASPGGRQTTDIITASLEGQTRTVLFDETKVWWRPQDEIAVFDGNGLTRFTATNEEDAPVVQFRGAGPIVVGEGFLYAVYPYSEAAAFRDGVLTAELPALQRAAEGTFDDDLLVTAARSSSAEMSFLNVCSGIRFTVSTEGIRKVILRGNNDEPLSGKLSIAFGEDGLPAVTAEGAAQVVLNAPEGETLKPGTPYFIILPPTTFERGLTMEFITTDRSCIKSLNRKVELRRAVFGSLAEADQDLQWDQVVVTEDYLFNMDPAKDYVREFWDVSRMLTFYNVRVPELGSTDTDDCNFVNNLNASFNVWPKGSPYAGIMKLSGEGGEQITTIRFYFSTDMPLVKKVGDLDVTFSTADDGETLLASLGGAPEVVATIDNHGIDKPNTITLNRGSEVAKALLNTGVFHVLISAKGYLCCNSHYQADIAFNRRRHFEAAFLSPLNVTGTAKDSFIDGVDFGEKGSFIRLEDLVSPTDWRGRSFDDYPNYWDYYGPFSFTADLVNAKCDLNGPDSFISIPPYVFLNQNSLPQMGQGEDLKTSRFGFITYRNNGTGVRDFNFYVNVTVSHRWGDLHSGYIRIPVQGTI